MKDLLTFADEGHKNCPRHKHGTENVRTVRLCDNNVEHKQRPSVKNIQGTVLLKHLRKL